ARAIKWRRESGLDGDGRFVRSLRTGRARIARVSQARFGVPLTPSEERTMRARIAVERAVPALAHSAQTRFGGSYSGTFIDQAHGGLVYVGFRNNSAKRLRVLARHFSHPRLDRKSVV